MSFLIVAAIVLGYYVAGIVSSLLFLRLAPEWFLNSDRSGWFNSDRHPTALVDGRPRMILATAIWPLAWFGVVVHLVFNASLRSIVQKTATRIELERELAQARKEVDDLLRRQ